MLKRLITIVILTSLISASAQAITIINENDRPVDFVISTNMMMTRCSKMQGIQPGSSVYWVRSKLHPLCNNPKHVYIRVFGATSWHPQYCHPLRLDNHDAVVKIENNGTGMGVFCHQVN